jgi:hypothetical protein
MSSSISKIPGIGEVTLEAFNRAGYRTVQDLYRFDVGDVAGDRLLMVAINDMKSEARPPLPSRYYRSLGTRCVNIVNRVRNAAALPYAPDYLLCNISFDLMQDPVIAPSGYTYERANIEEWIDINPCDPMTRRPLTVEQLYPARAIKEAIHYYRNNYQSFVIPKIV